MTAEFSWKPEHEQILKDISSTDTVSTEWSDLKNMIKYKITENMNMFLSTTEAPPPPAPFQIQTLPSGGLKLPPFPPRQMNQLLVNDPPVNYMTREQAEQLEGFIFVQLDQFDENPPFTIQRVCELCIFPKQHYNSVGKYLRAVEKTLLVTSTFDAFPPITEAERVSINNVSSSSTSMYSVSAPSTPLFSPITFLHERSPGPPSPLVLGVVDELDDPGPGHMSERPVAISATTEGTLESRFVKADEMNVDDDKENTKSG